jgi:hypothetical protein
VRAGRVFVREHLFVRKSLAAVLEAFGNAYRDEEAWSETILMSLVSLHILLYFGLRFEWYTLYK